MKNNRLLPMYRMYSIIIIIVAFLVLVLSNIFLLNKFEAEKSVNITNEIQKMNAQKNYIDKGMALMFINVYLQRNCIEDSLSKNNQDIPVNDLISRFQYDDGLRVSSMDAYQTETASEFGNIIINGNIKDIDADEIKEICSMLDVFKFQDYLNRNTMFNVWSAYYALKGYITIYPYSYTKDLIADKDEVFNAVNSSIDQLNQLNDDAINKKGWETDIFWDNTKSAIMLSKSLPVMTNNRIVGIVTSNISIDDIKNNIEVAEDNEIYIVDTSDQIVFKNNNVISKIETLKDFLKTRYNTKDLEADFESEKFYKVNNDYIINCSLENVQWKMIYVVSGNKIERPLLQRLLMIGLVNASVIFAVIILLFLIKRYYKKFRRIDELKTEFLMVISHDLKAPLYNILGFTELIHNKFNTVVRPEIENTSLEISATADKIQRNLGIIEKEANRLTALVDNLLDMSKLDSGEVVLDKEVINISGLCQAVFETTYSLANSTGINYTMEIEPDLPEITADRKKLIQVLVNIVSNAVKFTEAGYIVCKVKRKEQNIVFSIEDTGVGIPQNMQKIIFNKFERGKYQADKKIPGSGVGLSICKSIIELHGGEIWVESKVNEGSIFSFSIPIDGKQGGM